MKNAAICENHLFSKAYAKGKKCVCHHIIVYTMQDYFAEKLRKANPEKQRVNRLGITTSKKLGGAVARVRARRIIREAYRLLEKEAQVKHGFLVVIVARQSAVTAKTQDIDKDLRFAFRKLELLEKTV